MQSGDQVQREVRSALGYLRPHRLDGVDKVRLGGAHDGGYVCVDDFAGIDTALSLGIDHNVSWDADVADRGPRIFQFDHTVDAPCPDDPRMIFARKKIVPHEGVGTESLSSLVRRHDRGGARPNMLLKIDIENDEWSVFDATYAEVLGRFSQIACELHAFEDLHDRSHRERVTRVLEKLHRRFAVVHVHANNYAGATIVAGVFVPNVLEVTFANRSVYALTPGDELFPGELDAPCNPDAPDYVLGTFRY